MVLPDDHQQGLPEAGSEALRALNNQQPSIIVMTGIMAAGKSTIAHLLAQRFERGVHIEADVLQRMIVSGGGWVSQPGEPEGEAARQLRLRLKNMCLLGRSFFEAGFTVVLDDIILGDRWNHLQEELHGFSFFSPRCRCHCPAARSEALKGSTRFCLRRIS